MIARADEYRLNDCCEQGTWTILSLRMFFKVDQRRAPSVTSSQAIKSRYFQDNFKMTDMAKWLDEQGAEWRIQPTLDDRSALLLVRSQQHAAMFAQLFGGKHRGRTVAISPRN